MRQGGEMRFWRMLVWGWFLCAVAISAQGQNVHEAWVRRFGAFFLTDMFRDNLGNIAIVGSGPTISGADLLNRHGKTIAEVRVPIPWAIAAVDSSGRVYF